MTGNIKEGVDFLNVTRTFNNLKDQDR